MPTISEKDIPIKNNEMLLRSKRKTKKKLAGEKKIILKKEIPIKKNKMPPRSKRKKILLKKKIPIKINEMPPRNKTKTKIVEDRQLISNQRISEGGIFCYMPYNTLDTHNKSYFKIESGLNIKEEIEKLKIFFPTGFFVISILTSPIRGKKTIDNHEIYYKMIRDKIIELAINGSDKSDGNIDDGWVHCIIDSIHEAFKKAEKMYGGDRQEFGLIGMTNDTKELVNIKNTKEPVYVGKIIFHT
jgi:hypothetical protein